MNREPNEHAEEGPDARPEDARPEDDFARRLDEALDERRPLNDLQWTESARDDSAHRELLEGYRALNEGLRQRRSRPEARPSADLAARVLSQLRTERSAEKATPAEQARPALLRFRQPLVWAALAAAACLVVAPLVYFQMLTPSTGPAVAITKTPTDPNILPHVPTPDPKLVKTPPVVAPSADPALRSLVAEAGGHYLELAKETRESFADVALLLPGVTAGEPNAGAKKQWIDQVGDGLKPVTRSVGGAFDFLLQAIPIEEPRS